MVGSNRTSRLAALRRTFRHRCRSRQLSSGAWRRRAALGHRGLRTIYVNRTTFAFREHLKIKGSLKLLLSGTPITVQSQRPILSSRGGQNYKIAIWQVLHYTTLLSLSRPNSKSKTGATLFLRQLIGTFATGLCPTNNRSRRN